jgi:hypothetical protein
MLCKTMIALLATAALSVLAPGVASARGGFGGGHGGFGGGGFHGGGGGFHGFSGFHGGGGWHGGGVAAFHGVPNAGVAFRGAPMGGVAFHRVGMVGGPHFVPGFHHGFRRHVFVAGAAVVGPYGYYDDNYQNYGYADDGYYDNGYVGTGCALVQQPVPTPYGWVYRTVQVCQ